MVAVEEFYFHNVTMLFLFSDEKLQIPREVRLRRGSRDCSKTNPVPDQTTVEPNRNGTLEEIGKLQAGTIFRRSLSDSEFDLRN